MKESKSKRIIKKIIYILYFLSVLTIIIGLIIWTNEIVKISFGVLCFAMIIGAVLFLSYKFKKYRENVSNREKKIENAILVAQSHTSTKNQIVSSISYEFIGPLNNINIEVTKMMTNINNPNKVKESLHAVSNYTNQSIELYKKLLSVSKTENDKFAMNDEEFSLVKLFTFITNKFYGDIKEKGLIFSYDCYNIIHEKIYGDFSKIEQVFSNILNYSINRSPEKSHLSIKVIEINSLIDNIINYQFSIIDEGNKLSEGYINDLFTTFNDSDSEQQLKFKSTNIEMLVAKNMLKMLEGDVNIQSNDNNTNFVFTIPLENRTILSSYDNYNSKEVLFFSNNSNDVERIVNSIKASGINCKGLNIDKKLLNNLDLDKYFVAIIDADNDLTESMFIADILKKENIKVLLASYEINLNSKYFFITKPIIINSLIRKLFNDNLPQLNNEKTDIPNLIGKRILIVEDNKISFEITKEILLPTNAIVEMADNGKVGSERVLSSSNHYFDFIFMDLQMPIMNGYDATIAIRNSMRKDLKNIPIVAMTANTFPDDIMKLKNIGMNDYLAKPIDVEELYKVLRLYLK